MSRLLALASTLTVLLGAHLGAAAAQAEDAFYFENQTGQLFSGFIGPPEGECWFGQTGALAPGTSAAASGSIRSEVGFECNPVWASMLAYGQTYIGSYQHEGEATPQYLWNGGVGAIDFLAEDPLIGSSTVQCMTRGVEAEEAMYMKPIERVMSVEADGRTCTVDWLPGAGPGASAAAAASGTATASAARGFHTRIVASLARVEGGRAYVRLQSFGPARQTMRDRAVLRRRSGELIGRAELRLVAGTPAETVAVPLSRRTRAALAKGGELIVRASVEHADGTLGSGDTAAKLVLR